MRHHLRSLRRQRERGRQRVAAVTAGSALGATALAAAFGAVLAAGQVAPSKPASTVAGTASKSEVRPVDSVAELASPGAPDRVPGVTQAAPGTAPLAERTAPLAEPTRRAASAHHHLQAPATAPSAAPKETAQAPSGAS
jgi:hypothetical protein